MPIISRCFIPISNYTIPGPTGACYEGFFYYLSPDPQEQDIHKVDLSTGEHVYTQDISSIVSYPYSTSWAIDIGDSGLIYIRTFTTLYTFDEFPLTSPIKTVSLGNPNLKYGLAVDEDQDYYIHRNVSTDKAVVRKLSDNSYVTDWSDHNSRNFDFWEGNLYSFVNPVNDPTHVYLHSGLTGNRAIYLDIDEVFPDADLKLDSTFRFYGLDGIIAGHSGKICYAHEEPLLTTVAPTIPCCTIIPRTFSPTTELPSSRVIPKFKTGCDFKGQMVIGNLF